MKRNQEKGDRLCLRGGRSDLASDQVVMIGGCGRSDQGQGKAERAGNNGHDNAKYVIRNIVHFKLLSVRHQVAKGHCSGDC
jgi:hypothetical protein